MSLDSTGNLKQQLHTNLGPKAPIYFEALQGFVTGKISRTEFEEAVRSVLITTNLGELHLYCGRILVVNNNFQCTYIMPLSSPCSMQQQHTNGTL